LVPPIKLVFPRSPVFVYILTAIIVKEFRILLPNKDKIEMFNKKAPEFSGADNVYNLDVEPPA
jgi:hypothetical protein